VVRLTGTPKIESEDVYAYEAGYRVRPSANTSFDVAGFYNHYENVIRGDPFHPPVMDGGLLAKTIPYENSLNGNTKGIEVSAAYQPAERLRLRGTYSYIHFSFTAVDPELGVQAPDSTLSDRTPAHQAYLATELRLPWHLESNTAVRFVDRLSIGVASYTQFDSSLGWSPNPKLRLSGDVENLLDHKHTEFIADEGVQSAHFGRSAYGKITWRF
jgi:iron complex outermembrane receptor protein